MHLNKRLLMTLKNNEFVQDTNKNVEAQPYRFITARDKFDIKTDRWHGPREFQCLFQSCAWHVKCFYVLARETCFDTKIVNVHSIGLTFDYFCKNCLSKQR